MKLGTLIAQKRKSMSLTQEELATKMNVSKSAIGKWESNGGMPARDNIFKLANVLLISVKELQQIITGEKKKNEFEDLNITADIISILDSHGYKVIRKESEMECGGERYEQE